MNRRELERRLRSAGWKKVRCGRRHDVWGREELEIAVPRHTEINELTSKSILRSAEGERP